MYVTNMEDEQFIIDDAGNAGASLTFPAQANALKKGGHAMLKGKPCKIIEVTKAKPGKHGHAKCTFFGKDIFTGAMIEDQHPASHNMEVPVVKKTEYDLSHISRDGFLSLFGEGGEKQDVKLPEGELGEKIRGYLAADKAVTVVIQAAMGQEIAVDAKAMD
ncbi:Eukaryotic translation initiation factor 5A-2 [Lachnellula suecica]|uniref:Eukaryotic translation initiation factor 5A n=1 Tax=Lachnellula suecica TaxID=602035 RepID=A0A8T9C4U8_9HELO|nr:Eukaryotic translation initiation factor 5A-2 [Lachnellula suecica]